MSIDLFGCREQNSSFALKTVTWQKNNLVANGYRKFTSSRFKMLEQFPYGKCKSIIFEGIVF